MPRLLGRSQPRSGAEMDALLWQYDRFFWGIVRASYQDPADYEDGMQLARLAFASHYDKFPGGNQHAWLRCIIQRALNRDLAKRARRHACLMRNQHRIAARDLVNRTDLAAANLLRDDVGFEAEADLRVVVARWLAAVRVRNADFADVLRLYYIEGHEVSAVALRLGVSTGTIKSRLSRARALLREIAQGDELWDRS